VTDGAAQSGLLTTARPLAFRPGPLASTRGFAQRAKSVRSTRSAALGQRVMLIAEPVISGCPTRRRFLC
jgi:hypothetical protein